MFKPCKSCIAPLMTTWPLPQISSFVYLANRHCCCVFLLSSRVLWMLIQKLVLLISIGCFFLSLCAKDCSQNLSLLGSCSFLFATLGGIVSKLTQWFYPHNSNISRCLACFALKWLPFKKPANLNKKSLLEVPGANELKKKRCLWF